MAEGYCAPLVSLKSPHVPAQPTNSLSPKLRGDRIRVFFILFRASFRLKGSGGLARAVFIAATTRSSSYSRVAAHAKPRNDAGGEVLEATPSTAVQVTGFQERDRGQGAQGPGRGFCGFCSNLLV